MERNPNTDVDKLITFGKMALEQGWYAKAREYFEQALALDASNQEAREALAAVEAILARQVSLERIEPELAPAGEEMQISHEEEKIYPEAQEETSAVEPMQEEPVEPPRKVVQKPSIPKNERRQTTAFRAAKCPSCGGPLRVPEDRETVKCMYCGSEIVVRQAIRMAAGGNIANWLMLAKEARDADNYKEAFDYCTRVLEVDPHNYEAWFGKGEAAGWMSTLLNMRFSEMLRGFGNAMEYAPEGKQDKIRARAVDSINSITVACYRLARNHLDQFISVESAWEDYLGRCALILKALEDAYSLFPQSPQIIENIIFICRDNIQGVAYQDRFDIDRSGNPRRKVARISRDYEATLRAKMDRFVKKRQQIGPSYQPPRIKKASTAGCFVATATMGNSQHPFVVLLREFRDTWLLETRGGRIFVRFYYCFGPCLARFIGRNRSLQRLSYFLLVRPCAWVASMLLTFSQAKSHPGTGR